MLESTPMERSNGGSNSHNNNNNSTNSTTNGKKKRHKFPHNEPTDLYEGIDFDQFDAMVPGMDKTNVLVNSHSLQLKK